MRYSDKFGNLIHECFLCLTLLLTATVAGSSASLLTESAGPELLTTIELKEGIFMPPFMVKRKPAMF